MATALRSNWSYADAYGLLESAAGDHLLILTKAYQPCTPISVDALNPEAGIDPFDENSWIAYSVTYDPGDVQGTFREPGHPGVIGLWLTAYSQSWAADAAHRAAIASVNLSDCTVTEAAGDAAYMFRRGLVWPPDGREHAYP